MLDSEIAIREARIDEIIDLRWEILRAGLTRDAAHFDGDNEPTTHHFAATSNARVIACATFLRRPFNGEPAWQLRGMAVAGEFQKSGVGKRLLEFAEDFVLAEGFSNLLWCNARVPASRFYQLRGWQIISQPFDIPTAGPHVKMMKRINAKVR